MGTHKWAIIAGAVVGGAVLLAGLGFGVSTIAAQGPETTPTVEVVRPGLGGDCPCGVSRGEAMRSGWQLRGQAEIVAEALGMSVPDLTAALQKGKTVADLAAEKGIALDTIVEALLAPRQEALSQAVANGRLTQEQANRVLEQMRERIATRLQEQSRFTRTGPAGRIFCAERLGWQMRGQAEIIAETLGMSVPDLTAALRDGRTVADLATEKGVALDTIVEALLAPRREALSQAVASGRLTQEQADRMLEQMRENITTRLQQPWQRGAWSGSAVKPDRGMMGGGMGRGMGGRGTGRGLSGAVREPTQ